MYEPLTHESVLSQFICSSCNNIQRITSMLTSLRQRYGTHLLTVNGLACYSFPTLDALAKVCSHQHL